MQSGSKQGEQPVYTMSAEVPGTVLSLWVARDGTRAQIHWQAETASACRDAHTGEVYVADWVNPVQAKTWAALAVKTTRRLGLVGKIVVCHFAEEHRGWVVTWEDFV